MKTLIIISWVFIFSIIVFHITQDAYDFHSVVDSSYNTPWYDNSWIKEPYTMIRLSNKKKVIYWTKNAVGDDWRVQDVHYKNTVFWTILEIKKKH